MKYLLFIIYVSWSACSGAVEAILYSKKASDAFKWNEHIVLTIQRILVVDMIFCTGWIMTHGSTASLTIPIGFSDTMLSISIILLAFSLPHDGMYYVFRRLIDPDLKYGNINRSHTSWLNSFLGESDSSTAIINIHPSLRVIMFIGSVMGLMLL